jgi:serine/threonine protein kinase
VHRDITPENITLANVNGRDGPLEARLVDLTHAYPYNSRGSVEDLNVAKPYCAPIEMYEAREKQDPADRRASMQRCNIPPSDIYGLGMNMLPMLFGWVGEDAFDKNFLTLSTQTTERAPSAEHLKEKRQAHVDPHTSRREREKFPGRIGDVVGTCNGRLPEGKQYTDAQCEFIANAIGACMNPDPKKRPSAAQVAVIFEQFSAGETNFGKASRKARIDYPDKPGVQTAQKTKPQTPDFPITASNLTEIRTRQAQEREREREREREDFFEIRGLDSHSETETPVSHESPAQSPRKASGMPRAVPLIEVGKGKSPGIVGQSQGTSIKSRSLDPLPPAAPDVSRATSPTNPKSKSSDQLSQKEKAPGVLGLLDKDLKASPVTHPTLPSHKKDLGKK